MTTRLAFPLRALGVALAAALVLAMPAVADDHDDDHGDDDHHHGTATTTATPGSDDDRFGAFIRAGACEAPGDVVEEIGELEDEDDRDDADDTWRLVGGGDPAPDVLYDEDEGIGQTIDELTGGEFVVTVHEGESADSPVIACGTITGAVGSDGTLLIDLDEVDDSGFEGRAHLGPDDDDANDDDDDDQTDVTVAIWEAEPAGGV